MASKLQAVAPQLWSYWTHGKGLARWAGSATPYRTLVLQLTEEKVPAGMVAGLAARIYHAAKGVWPGGQGKGRSRSDWTGAEHRAAYAPDDDVRCVVAGCKAVATEYSLRSFWGALRSVHALVCADHVDAELPELYQ